jgi:hypothetical protein
LIDDAFGWAGSIIIRARQIAWYFRPALSSERTNSGLPFCANVRLFAARRSRECACD